MADLKLEKTKDILDSIRKTLEEAHRDFVSPDDLAKFLKVIAELINKRVDDIYKKVIDDTNSKILEINKISVRELHSELNSLSQDIKSELSNNLKKIEKKIPKDVDLSYLEEEIRNVEKKIPTIPDIPNIDEIVNNIPIVGEKVRDSLEILNGDERLDIKAIKGLDDYEKVSKLAKEKSRKIEASGGISRGIADGIYVTGVNVRTITVSDAEPLNPQENDLWLV